MNPDYPSILPYAVALLAVFVIYRRFRRLFGRQPLAPARMKIRIGILAVLGCTLLPLALHSRMFCAAELLGMTSGIALGVWGSTRTRFQTIDGRLHYVPHTLTGVAVSLLLVGRLAYRIVSLYESGRTGDGIARGFEAHSMMSSPLTVAMVFAVVGYYVSYYGLILRRSANLNLEDLEIISRQATGST